MEIFSNYREHQENMTLEAVEIANIAQTSEEEVEIVTLNPAHTVPLTDDVLRMIRKQMKRNKEPLLMKKDQHQISQKMVMYHQRKQSVSQVKRRKWRRRKKERKKM